MIGWLRGEIRDKPETGKLVIDVNGVGYEVETSMQTFFQVDSQQSSVTLYIHTQVREDAFLLYGFLEKSERSLFKALIKVNGIGPKLAMSILSNISPWEFVQTVAQKNILRLTQLPGIGRKSAERLLIEMVESIKQVELSSKDQGSLEFSARPRKEQEEAVTALEALGYKPQEALKTVKSVDDGIKNCEQLIRQSLQLLGTHC